MVLTIDPIDPNLTLSGTSKQTRPDDPGPGLPKHSEFLAQGRSSKAPRRYLHPPEMFQPTRDDSQRTEWTVRRWRKRKKTKD